MVRTDAQVGYGIYDFITEKGEKKWDVVLQEFDRFVPWHSCQCLSVNEANKGGGGFSSRPVRWELQGWRLRHSVPASSRPVV